MFFLLFIIVTYKTDDRSNSLTQDHHAHTNRYNLIKNMFAEAIEVNN